VSDMNGRETGNCKCDDHFTRLPSEVGLQTITSET